MTEDELRKLEQARPAGRREPLWGDMTDLTGDPEPEPAPTNTDFLTSKPENWNSVKPITVTVPVRRLTPDETIQTIEGSLRCLRHAVFGLIPLIGFPFVVMALGDFGRVRRAVPGWHPAERYARGGVWLAMLGLGLTILVGVWTIPVFVDHFFLSSPNVNWFEVAIIVGAPLMLCLGRVRECCSLALCGLRALGCDVWRAFNRYPFAHSFWILMWVAIASSQFIPDPPTGAWKTTQFLVGFLAVPLAIYATVGSFTTRLDASFQCCPGGHLAALTVADLVLMATIVKQGEEVGWLFVLAAVALAPFVAKSLRGFHTPGFAGSLAEHAWFLLLWPALVLPVILHASVAAGLFMSSE